MSTQRAFTGRSGQLAVIAELLFRQCNAAIPEVDLGTDVFAFQDTREEIARLQVKTEQGEHYKKGDGHSAKFRIPLKQLEHPDKPRIHYALAVRLEAGYADFLIIGRAQLNGFWTSSRRFGTTDREGNLVMNVQFRKQVVCGEIDLTEFRNAWHLLPPLERVPPIKEEGEPVSESYGKEQALPTEPTN